MSQVILLDTTSSDVVVKQKLRLFEIGLENSVVRSFRNLAEMLAYVSVTGASELDINYPTIIVINDETLSPDTPEDQLKSGVKKTPLNTLSYAEVEELLHHHYKHLVVLTYKLSEVSLTRINDDIAGYHETLKNRIVRMKTWVGLNNSAAKRCPCLHSMTNCLSTILHSDYELHTKMRRYVEFINAEVDFLGLLTLPKDKKFYKHCIGNWGFIAHELTCDELTYCALLIFQQAFSILEPNGDCLKLSDNDILSFLFSLRDSYRGGNSFHNFRHAVDVLQATFYFLVRLGTIPRFTEFTEDYSAHPQDIFDKTASEPSMTAHFEKEASLLDPIQTLALLVSSVGHDVGHPGLTNAFLIQHKSPVARVYSNQSVMENYHSTIFQDILGVHWPQFLTNEHTAKPENPLNTRAMQVESIIATDMANHFEYISKVEEISEVLKSERLKVKHSLKHTGIILSLIIKCADISNVARPLLISTKWGIVLGREFDEIALLAENMTTGKDIDSVPDRRDGPFFPESVDAALMENPNLAKGQLFFINTFADSLFNEVATVLPELRFSAQIVLENKKFWMTLS